MKTQNFVNYFVTGILIYSTASFMDVIIKALTKGDDLSVTSVLGSIVLAVGACTVVGFVSTKLITYNPTKLGKQSK